MRPHRILGGSLTCLLPVVALCAAPFAATAQDSTALGSGLPGDAVDPHLTAEQENNFVADMAAFRSSWNNVYGIAPIAKASAQYSPSPTFFNAQISAQAASVDQRLGVPFPNNSYLLWTQPGQGVNNDPTLNATPSGSVNTSLFVGNQMAVTFAEFSNNDPTNPGVNFNNIVSGIISYEVDSPSRLYVSRVMAAVNSPSWQCDLAQFGIGGIDSNGFVHYRADAFGSFICGPQSPVVGENLYRTNTLGRNTNVLNVISSTGGSDATVHLLQNSTTCNTGFAHTHLTPTQIPSSVTGGVPILIGNAFNCPAGFPQGPFVHGSSMPLTYSTAHLTGASDGRGTVGYTKAAFPVLFGAGATRGTAAILGQDVGTNRLQIFGLNASGAPLGTISRALPAVLTDNEDGWPSNSLGAGQLRFNNYFSQVAFRGGNGMVALGEDQQGNLIAAACVDHPSGSGNDHPNNLIAVARTTTAGVTTWGIAAYVADATGKTVYDSAGGSAIGTLFTLETLTGGITRGPSISSPMLDSVGNVYFTAPVDLASGDDGVGLLRAVYDAASLSYELELVLLTGDVFHGQNSDRDYQVTFLPLSDGNSISSGAPYSGNICQDAHNGLDPSTLPVASTETLGGLVLNASIIYDVNQDGLFEDLTANPSTPDQEYTVALLVGHAKDCNDNGVPDDLDINNGTSTDVDGNGVPDECGAGTTYCFGDGSGTPCPCGNAGGPGEGCANSTGSGAVLFTTGSSSVSADDLGFTADNLLPNQPALLFVGTNAVNGGNGSNFGDGLRCAGQNVVRLGVETPNGTGMASWGPGLAAQGGWQAGDTRFFQTWYRNPSGSPCGFGFNLSHGVSVAFVP